VRYELYVDEFFLLNFFMDTLLLLLMRKVLRCTATHLRIFLGGAFGGLAACLVTVLPMVPAWLKLSVGYGAVSLCMIKLCFCGMNWRAVCRAAVCLYGFAFLFGGALELLSIWLPLAGAGRVGPLGVCMAGTVTYVVCSFFWRKWRRRREESLVSILLTWKDRSVRGQALLDTGNGLYEPISGKPVTIAERALLEELFAGAWPEGFRAIPFHSVGRARGILPGYELTELVVFGENEKIRIEKPMVGCFDGKLSVKAAYQVLLHPALVNSKA